MDINFLITTYNRQQSCQRLVNALQGQGDITVLNDGSDYDIYGCTKYMKLQRHNARQYYWRTVETLFRHRGQYRYYIMIPDDFLPADGMVEDALKIWENINDDKKVCLNLYADRIGLMCWTRYKPVDYGNVWKTGWVDMCFLCDDTLFNHIHSMKSVRPMLAGSSGVGQYISRKLYRNKFSLYQVKKSLVIPQEEHGFSQMHNPANQYEKAPYGTKGLYITDTRNSKRFKP